MVFRAAARISGGGGSGELITSVQAATTGALANTPTYDNGSSGVGATLTAGSNGALPAQDGITLVANDRLLVKNQASALQNGVYTVTQVGSAGTPYILTRATDYDTSAEITYGSIIPVEAGTTLAGTLWMLTGTGTITVGTTALNYTQVNFTANVVTAAAVLTDDALIKGDGGARGVQTTGITIADTTNAMSGVGPIAITGGTVTSSTPLISGTQTWNSGGTTFRGVEWVITDTGSAAASTAFRILGGAAGTTNLLSLDKSGIAQIGPLGNSGVVTGGINFGFANVPTTVAGAQINGYVGSALAVKVAAISAGSLIHLNLDSVIQWQNNASLTVGAIDLIIVRDAANTLALRNGTNSQTENIYDTFTSSTDYHRVAIKTARATLSGVSGASVTATGLIPDGAVVVGVTSKVTTGLGTGGGTTGYAVGTVADPNRWGDVVGTAAGTSSDNRDWTAGTIEASIGATDVIVTAAGGNFDGTGVIYLSVQYLIGQCD